MISVMTCFGELNSGRLDVRALSMVYKFKISPHLSAFKVRSFCVKNSEKASSIKRLWPSRDGRV